MVAYRRALELLRADRRLVSLEALPEPPARHFNAEGALELRAALDAIAAAGLSRRRGSALPSSIVGDGRAVAPRPPVTPISGRRCCRP
jgi:hypothetical protein